MRAIHSSIIALLALMAVSHVRAAQPSGTPSPEMKRTRYLVLDSRIIHRVTAGKLTLGKVKKDKRNPLLRGDKPWEPNVSNGYPNVTYDEHKQLYECWYSPWIVCKATASIPREKRKYVPSLVDEGASDGSESRRIPYIPDAVSSQPHPTRESGVCYATSRDGIHWRKPELGIAELNGSTKNNIVFSAHTIPHMATSPDLKPSVNRGPHGAGVFRDLRESDPAKRYKMVFRDYAVSEPEKFYVSVAFSLDGLHWKPVPCPETGAHGDTHNNAFWAPELQKYVLITRLWDNGRCVGRCESEDFVNWTKAEVVLRGIYSMPVFRYAGIYLGFPAIYAGGGGRVHTELAWSSDTIEWHRISLGKPLIANAKEMGLYDWGCVFASTPIFSENEIRMYYMGDPHTHHSWRGSGLCLASLRPDGFAGYEPAADETPAIITTNPLVCSGQMLRISADVRGGGSIRVMLVDERDKELAASIAVTSQPEKWKWPYEINTEYTDKTVEWIDGRDFSVMNGKVVRLKFVLKDAKLYSFSFAAHRKTDR